jgi:hypothetical protein
MPAGTPYITPGVLLARPAGISWTVVPRLNASTADQMAQLTQVCWNATSAVDTYARQPLRATVNTETNTGPGQPRVSVDRNTRIATLVTRRWPVTAVAAVQFSQARSFPPVWTQVPSTSLLIRNPAVLSAVPTLDTLPTGGNLIDVEPGYLDWRAGRGAYRVQLSYVSAWPHTSLTADAAEDAETLQVDDVTGWAGTGGLIYDSPTTEGIEVLSVEATSPAELPNGAGTVQAGPGTLTLSAGLGAAHAAGTLVSAMPPIALRAAALAATVEALEAIDAIATQSQSGQSAGGTGALATEMEMLLDDFRRVI